MFGRVFWIIVGLLMLYVLVSNVLYMLTLGSYSGQPYDLIRLVDEVEVERHPVWIEGQAQPTGPHAVANMQAGYFGLIGDHTLPDGSIVQCRWFVGNIWCDTDWIVEQEQSAS